MLSIKQIALSYSRLVTKRIAILFFLLGSLFWILTEFSFHRKASLSTFNGIKQSLNNMLIQGDLSSINQLLMSLIEGEHFSGVWLFEESNNTPLSAATHSLSLKKYFQPRKQDTFFIACPDGLYLFLKNRVSQDNGQKFVLYIAQKINFLYEILLFLIIAFMVYITYRYLLANFLALGNKISKPLLQLESYIGHYKGVQQSDSTPLQIDCSEVNNLFKNFSNLMERLEKAERKRRRDNVNEAIAKTTQMLAHDIRQPFYMVKLFLQKIQREEDFERLRNYILKFSPEIERYMNAVNNLASDLLDIGKRSNIVKEKIDAEKAIIQAVESALSIFENKKVNVEYRFEHQHFLFVDHVRLQRLLGNIIANALQAVGDREEKLWIHTKEVMKKEHLWMMITIGNSGSFIPESEYQRIFEAFISTKKKEGTGLGLTIVRKIVDEHGGDIWCTSSEELGTEFHFLLPIAE